MGGAYLPQSGRWPKVVHLTFCAQCVSGSAVLGRAVVESPSHVPAVLAVVSCFGDVAARLPKIYGMMSAVCVAKKNGLIFLPEAFGVVARYCGDDGGVGENAFGGLIAAAVGVFGLFVADGDDVDACKRLVELCPVGGKAYAASY